MRHVETTVPTTAQRRMGTMLEKKFFLRTWRESW